MVCSIDGRDDTRRSGPSEKAIRQISETELLKMFFIAFGHLECVKWWGQTFVILFSIQTDLSAMRDTAAFGGCVLAINIAHNVE